jgi:acetamidase/formamidase
MAVHSIEPTVETLHGIFSRDFKPVMTIDAGDTVVYRTLDAGWGITGPEVPREYFQPRLPGRGDGHALCGPVAIRGAEPAMMLEVQIRSITPGPWGWTLAGGWESPLNRRLGLVGTPERRLNWQLDTKAMVGTDQHGHTVKLAPFMGVMGMPPDTAEPVSTRPPRLTGGNLDCKELVVGSTLYLPIAVSGGLFSVGDGHAAQGDGEISGMAIECPMERVELVFQLHDELPLKTPYANTPVGWITFGLSEDLNVATVEALEAMIRLMQSQLKLGAADAVALASVCVDLRITQIVNQVCGVHALLPHGRISSAT